MRQNAAQLNRMQIREQEALNRERRLQDDAAARREGQAMRRTQAQYDHVTSHGYGRGGTVNATSSGSAAPPSSSSSPSLARHTSSGSRGGANAQVAHGDDVQIKVYVRECEEDGRQAFTYRETGGSAGADRRVGSGPAGATSSPATASASRTPAGAAGGGGNRRPSGSGATNSTHSNQNYHTSSAGGGAARGPGVGRTSLVTSVNAPAGGGGAGRSEELVAPNRARVPRYLQQRKAEMAAEKEAVAAEAERQRQLSQIPPGHRRVSEDEKADTLRQIEERQQELEGQLARIPIRFDTQSIQQRRRAIEDELRELEAKRNKYSTKNPLYVPLN